MVKYYTIGTISEYNPDPTVKIRSIPEYSVEDNGKRYNVFVKVKENDSDKQKEAILVSPETDFLYRYYLKDILLQAFIHDLKVKIIVEIKIECDNNNAINIDNISNVILLKDY